MKILVVGSDINSILFAEFVKAQHPEHDIFLTSSDKSEAEAYTPVDIRENDIKGLVDFVKYNAIEFTVVFSMVSIINGIADIFKKEDFVIFAPLAESAKVTLFSSIAKKIMYKLKINTPRFGIFDRESIAIDFTRHARFPIAVLNDLIINGKEYHVYDTFSKAKLGIQKMFEDGNEKIIIENYIDTEPFYVYFITDGYNVLPLVGLKRKENEDYTVTISPADKITDDMIIKILQLVIYPLIDDIAAFSGPYTGIMGVKVKFTKDFLYVLEFYSGFEKDDFQSILSIFSEDISDVMYMASIGKLCDKYHYLNMKDKYSYTLELNSRDINYQNYKENEFIETTFRNKHVFTSLGLTQNNAKSKMFEFIEDILSADMYEKITKEECSEDFVH